MAKLNTKIVMLKGEQGKDGTTIKSVEKTASDGLTDTYTITLTDGSKSSFNVTNGKGISSIEKASANTYTINYNDGTTLTLTLDVDTELSTTSTNPVQNKAIAEGINSIQNQIVPTASIESGETASKAYNQGDFLVKDGILYKVTKAIVKDDALTVGTNIVMTTVGSELSEKSNKSFETIATATANGNVTTTKPLSEFNLFVFMLTIISGSYTIVLQTTFVTREIFEMEGTSLFVTNEIGNYMGRVKRVDDNTVNFFDFKNVKNAYFIGFY